MGESNKGPIFDLVAPHLQKIKSSGPRNIMALCPFHGERKPSFAINIENGMWICHGCGLRGGLVNFLRMVGHSRGYIDTLIEPLKEQLEEQKKRSEREARYRFTAGNPFRAQASIPEAVLGMFDFKPRALVQKDFDPDLLRQLDVGYDRRQDRIIFPIRDIYGTLVGVSGRATRIGDQPRYKVYRGGTKDLPGDFGELFDMDNPGYEVKSHEFLWNGHNVHPLVIHTKRASSIELIVVEGFKACIWMIQNGWPNTVALMGSSIGVTQADIVRRFTDTVILFLDNDEPGRKATYRIGKWLSKSLSVYVVQPDHRFFRQPDYFSREGLDRVVNGRMRFEQWAVTSTGIISRGSASPTRCDSP
jgi:DNA primase